jgi:hypothetical protein
MKAMAVATFWFRFAASLRGWNLSLLWRAIQYNAESPPTAPTAPASITTQRFSTPSDASVEAAFSVVSAGNSAHTASPNTSRKVVR